MNAYVSVSYLKSSKAHSFLRIGEKLEDPMSGEKLSLQFLNFINVEHYLHLANLFYENPDTGLCLN